MFLRACVCVCVCVFVFDPHRFDNELTQALEEADNEREVKEKVIQESTALTGKLLSLQHNLKVQIITLFCIVILRYWFGGISFMLHCVPSPWYVRQKLGHSIMQQQNLEVQTISCC